MGVSPAVSEEKAAETSSRPKRHSPVFLAVFAVFLITTVICVAGTVIGVAAAHPSHHDTQWFWASGHLLVHGKNPYDRAAVRQIEKSLGLPMHGSYVPMTLNPPYTLFLMTPIGFLGPRLGMVAWSLLLVGCLLLAVHLVRGMLDAPYERALLWLAWCFAPAVCCVGVGQTGLIVLVGLVLFLRFHESAPFWAGAGLSLCAIKPHLLLPFGVVLLAWIVARRRWTVLIGAAALIAFEGLFAMLFDHAIWSHYRAMMRTEGFEGYFIPTLGVALRFAIDRAAMWIEFIPAALGCAWGIWYFVWNREQWNWRTHGSLLVLVSLVVAPYAWFTDQVIALPAIMFSLLGPEKPRRGSLTLLLAVMSAGAVEMMIAPSLYFEPFLFQAIAWLAWYLYAMTGRTPGQGPLPSTGLANA
jgi:hypothetical protein